MPICPKCKEVIDKVTYSAEKETWGSVDVYEFENKDKRKEFGIDYDESEVGDWNNLKYFCPECNEEFEMTEEEIIDFLADKDELAELVAEKQKMIEAEEKAKKNGNRKP